MRKLIFLFAIFFTLTFSAYSQISFKGTADRAVVVNQQFRVNYTLTTDGDAGKDIRMPETKGLDILFGPTLSGKSSSTTIVNGNVSSQVFTTYTYVLIAKEEGTFTIPSATIKVGNSEYKSNEITVKVLPADQATQANSQNSRSQGQDAAQSSGSSGLDASDVFAKMSVSKSSVYENEGFLVTVKIYTAVNCSGFDNIKFPEFEGFVVQEVDLPDNRQWALENYNGRNYRSVVLKQAILYPQHSGKITIASGKYEANLQIRSQQRGRSFFDDFFDTYQNVKKTLTTSPITIDVKPLPAGKPASFTGAVGDYKMTSSISSTEVNADDAVTIKISITGTGNIKLIKNPEIVFPADIDVFDPKVDVSSKVSTSGVTGSKTVEYYAVPRYAGNFTIPQAQFSYFDLKTGTYKTFSTEEYQLNVKPSAKGSNNNAPTVVNSANKEDIRILGQDIRHIKTGAISFQKKDFLFGSLRYWLAYTIPAILFILFFIYFRQQVKQNADIALMRTKKANKVASQRLKSAGKYLKEDKAESFYDEILKAVWGYLSDKLNIPVSSLTKGNVEIELTKYGAKEDLISQFIAILDTAEFARFAPSQGHGAMDELYLSTVNAINKMENTVKK
ncbi:MAG: BatD family protein [Dysgonamonadaceae bacterium]|jgi:hypothetical protein|nr:BatD family protein [Dysgonamonadaceae bacterium]